MTNLTNNQKAAIKYDYAHSFSAVPVLHKPFAQAVLEILTEKGINTPTEFAERTGLNPNYYYTMQEPNKNYTLGHVMSIAIGLQIESWSMQKLLSAAGLSLNLNHSVARAYAFVHEYYRDLPIEDINGILQCLGIGERHYLGSHERPPYKKRKDQAKNT